MRYVSSAARWYAVACATSCGSRCGAATPAGLAKEARSQRGGRQVAVLRPAIAQAVLVLEEEAAARQLVEGLLEPRAAHVVALDDEERLSG